MTPDTSHTPQVRHEERYEKIFRDALFHFKKAEHEAALHLARVAARKGHVKAQYFLGLLYEHGFARGLAHEPERAHEKRLAGYWRQKAVAGGYEKPHDPKPVFPEAALLDEADASADQANPARDDRKAAALYRRVVDGNPEAVNGIGISCAGLAMESLRKLYDAGRGLTGDTEAWLTGVRVLSANRNVCGLAALTLCRMFAEGDGVERDETAATLLLLQILQDGWDMPEAQYELGRRYLEGRGVTRDDAQAAAWLARAARGGLPAACCMMGHLYRDGRGVGKDAREAVRWYRKVCEHANDFEWIGGERHSVLLETTCPGGFPAMHACLRHEAEGGNTDAWFVLGVLSCDGLGVKKSPARAAFWVKKAARAGDAEAQYLLGHFAEQGIGMKKSVRAALRWRQKAAEQDFMFAHNFDCFGGDDDGEKKRWLMRQAGKGNTFALYELAILERTIPKRRARLLRQAAEQGDRSAQALLGEAYCTGYGVERDYAQAAYWYGLAAENPETPPHFENEPGLPQSDLAHLYREGKGVQRDPVAAVRWYERSLDDVNCGADLALGMACEVGYGVKQDTAKARKLYQRLRGNIRVGADDLAAFFLECMGAP